MFILFFFFSLFMLSEGASAYERIYKESEKKILNGKIKFTWRMGMRNGAWGMGWDESKCKLVHSTGRSQYFVLIYPVCTEYVIRDRAMTQKNTWCSATKRREEKKRKEKQKKKNKLRLCHGA